MIITANRLVYWLSRRWLLVFSLLLALWVGLPWLAPVFMEMDWTNAGRAIYLLYAPQCHQLPLAIRRGRYESIFPRKW